MSHKHKGSSALPPLESVRSPRQGKRTTSYDYRPDSTSPTTSPRSPDPGRRGPGEGKTSPRNPAKEVSKEFRTLCIGSPIPDTDPHADDMVVTTGGGDHHKAKPKPFRKTPSITIDRVEELNLTKDSKKSPRGGQPLSPVSYDLIEHMPTTPFATSGKGSDRHLMTSPITPPVERKGNRHVINYCRSDGHLPSSACADDKNDDEEDVTQRWHSRSQTDGSQSEGHKKSRDRRSGRDLTPSPRLTRRARENERSFSPAAVRDDPSPSPRRQRGNSNDQHTTGGRREQDMTSSSPRQQRRRKNTPTKGELETISPRSDGKKPVRLEPLGKK